jgi:hypothetical protein
VQGLADEKNRFPSNYSLFEPYLIPFYFPFLQRVALDKNKTVSLTRAAISSFGDICQYFHNSISGRYGDVWMISFLRESYSIIKEDSTDSNDDLSWAFQYISKCIQFK